MYKGSSRLQLTVKEEIRAVQYDRPDVADVWEIYGSVQCKVRGKQNSSGKQSTNRYFLNH